MLIDVCNCCIGLLLNICLCTALIIFGQIVALDCFFNRGICIATCITNRHTALLSISAAFFYEFFAALFG